MTRLDLLSVSAIEYPEAVPKPQLKICSCPHSGQKISISYATLLYLLYFIVASFTSYLDNGRYDDALPNYSRLSFDLFLNIAMWGIYNCF